MGAHAQSDGKRFMSTNRLQRVVITGIGLTSAIGHTVDDFWTNLLAGQSGVAAYPGDGRIRLTKEPYLFGKVKALDAVETISTKLKRRVSNTSRFALYAAQQALADANLTDAALLREAAVIVGSSNGGFAHSDNFFKGYYDEGFSSPFVIPSVMNNAPSANISIHLGLKGPNMNVDSACASSAHSIGHAFNLIRFGKVKRAMTGGADSALSLGVIAAWKSLRALSNRHQTPQQACRPFSKDRDGTVLGEGAGILILESEEAALERGAKIYAEVKGYGATADGYHLTKPTIEGQQGAMMQAITDASINTTDIDYINAHGTATYLNDQVESASIKHVLGEYAYDLPVVSIKPMIGHSIGAVGALELISCVLSLRDQIVPPTINVVEADPDCDLDYVTAGKRQLEIRNIMSNSFAFGGSNAAVVIGQYR